MTLSVLKMEESDAVGDAHAAGGQRFLILTALGSGAASVGDNYLEVDVPSIARVAEADGHLYPAATAITADDIWSGSMRFVPGTPQRGRLIFVVPAPHAPLSLIVAVPNQPAPMRLPLSAAAASAAKPPAPSLSIADGSTGVFHLYEVRRTATGVVLDVGIENHTGSGMEFQTKEQIELLRGTTEITATDEDLAGLRALPEGGVIPPHTSGRWDIPFRVSGDPAGLTLYFRGFEVEKKVPLPPAAAR